MSLLMQFQADILSVPVVRPKVIETTALGSAYAAGLATKLWTGIEELKEKWIAERIWHPQMEKEKETNSTKNGLKAVEKSFGWEE